jgi:thymidylate synthase (FAD)
MTNELPVLDHGFVRLRNVAGPTRRRETLFDADDVDPANVARKSFDNLDSNRTREQELRLCDYLLRHAHSEPFEFIETWWEMKLPLFVAAQFKRHRTARLFESQDATQDPSIDEASLRYVEAHPEFYIPSVVGGKPENAKQGQDDSLPHHTKKWFREHLQTSCKADYANYKYALAQGVAPEHARLFLHTNHYTSWIWKQDLWNLFHFLALRDHSHAQIEAAAYAKAMTALLDEHLLDLMALYRKYRRSE